MRWLIDGVISVHGATTAALAMPPVPNTDTMRAIIAAREVSLSFYHPPLPSEYIFKMPKCDGSGELYDYVFKRNKHIVPAKLVPIEGVCTYKDAHFTGGKAFKAIHEARSLAKFEQACEEISRW